MGQYYMIANLDKKESIHPHKLCSGEESPAEWHGTIVKDAKALTAEDFEYARSMLAKVGEK